MCGGYSLVGVSELLGVVASVTENGLLGHAGFSSWGTWAQGSAAVAPGL